MTILTVALKYLRSRLVASTLTAVSIALGVSLVIAGVLLARGIKEGFIAGATDYNLVVGAKGSPTQLVLSVVFRMDLATPNIEYTTYRDLLQDPRVETAVPIDQMVQKMREQTVTLDTALKNQLTTSLEGLGRQLAALSSR